MKLQILPAAFRQALSAPRSVSKHDSVLPVLSNVLLSADGDTLTITGDNLRARVESRVAATVEEAGAITLPARALDDFLSICPSGVPVSMVVGKNNRAKLACGNAQVSLVGISADEFPGSATGDGDAWISVAASVLREGLQSVLHAAAQTDSRPVLEGVHFATGNNTVDGALALGTFDGYRAAMWKTPIVPIPETLTATVPAPCLKELVKALAFDESVEIRRMLGGALIRFVFGPSSWTIKTIVGDYPNLMQAVLKEYQAVISVDRSDMKQALKLARSFDLSGTKGVSRAALDIRQDSMLVVAKDVTLDQGGEMEIAATLESGEPKRVVLNAAYLNDAVDALNSDRITIEVPYGEGVGKPSLIRASGPRNGFLQFIAPIGEART